MLLWRKPPLSLRGPMKLSAGGHKVDFAHKGACAGLINWPLRAPTLGPPLFKPTDSPIPTTGHLSVPPFASLIVSIHSAFIGAIIRGIIGRLPE